MQNQLLTSQKDTVFEILTKNGFNPRDFRWTTIDNLPTLEYKEGEYFIMFFMSENMYRRSVSYSPGNQNLVENSGVKPTDWSGYLRRVEIWLQYLSKELNTRNFWGKLEIEKDELSVNGSDLEGMFTDTEKSIIVEKFNHIKGALAENGFNQVETEIINEKLDHLLEMSTSLNKFDWISLVVGTFASLSASLLITPERLKQLWELTRFYFENWLIGS